MGDGDVLRIEPGAAERIARALDLHAENLATVAQRLRSHAHSTGFAGFPSAVELHVGFTDKGKRAVEHLLHQIDVTRNAAASIRAAGDAYVNTDATGATAISASDDSIGGNPQ